MNIELPAIPTGVTVLLIFFAPYATAILNHPRWAAGSKKLVAIAVSIGLALLSLAFYYLLTGDAPLPWPAFIILFLVISQAAYALLLKPSAKLVENRVGPTDTIPPGGNSLF